jgi:hypothetical protein
MLLTLEVSDSTRSDHASDPRVDPTRFMHADSVEQVWVPL